MRMPQRSIISDSGHLTSQPKHHTRQPNLPTAPSLPAMCSEPYLYTDANTMATDDNPPTPNHRPSSMGTTTPFRLRLVEPLL